jgi:integrase
MDRWQRTYAPRPTLTLVERSDRGGMVYARWWERRDDAAGGWKRRSLGIRLRPRPGAPIDPEVEAGALDVGRRMHEALTRGADPASALDSAQLTVARALGSYIEAETIGLGRRYRGDVRRAAEIVSNTLGAETPWSALSPRSGTTIWRSLALQSPDGKGQRWAERVTELLWRTGSWVELTGRSVPGTSLRAPAGWRRMLRNDWGRLCDSETTTIARPRYTEEEAQALWAALEVVSAPLRLLVTIGAPELRLGQVARVRRSDVVLDLGTGAHGFGRVRVPGAGTKTGTWIDLDQHARRALEHELTDGYLTALERTFRNGELDDYPLIPGGPLHDGRARFTAPAPSPISMSTLRRWYRAWEEAAGIAHVPGRGWHALRRMAADLGAGRSNDSAVLDRLGSWRPGSGVRERVYRDREDERVRHEAELLRSELRASLRVSASEPERRTPHRIRSARKFTR